MSTVEKDRGSAILIQVTVKKNKAFSASEYFDPTAAPTITILDPQKQPKVSNEALTKKEGLVGRYFYVCQTEEDWSVGLYEARVKGGDGSYSDIKVNASAFRLT